MASAGEPLPQTASSLRFDVETGEHDDGLSAFVPVRPRLFGIAYSMLGNAAQGEDIVQDVWLRWQSTNRSVVENPPAFLAMTTTRLCINLAQSAHSRRETYIGTCLPEPVDTSSDPGLAAERGEALKLAVLVLLEKLSPTERAAYILREAFDYSYRQIADILQMEKSNTRQLVSRARKHIADGRRTPVSSGAQRRLLEAFIAAAQKGDMAALEGLFAEDVASCSDGGRIVRADGPSFWPQTCGDVHCRRRFTFLEGRDACLGRDKWTGRRSERRQHSRDAILGRVENITYSVLRRYGIPATRDAVINGTLQETVVVTNDFHAPRTEPGIPALSHRSRRTTAGSERRARPCRPIC
jgi:RNA polymerase sigma-70 factor (ECF subfamily)